jgi:hypothetical protein
MTAYINASGIWIVCKACNSATLLTWKRRGVAKSKAHGTSLTKQANQRATKISAIGTTIDELTGILYPLRARDLQVS